MASSSVQPAEAAADAEDLAAHIAQLPSGLQHRLLVEVLQPVAAAAAERQLLSVTKLTLKLYLERLDERSARRLAG